MRISLKTKEEKHEASNQCASVLAIAFIEQGQRLISLACPHDGPVRDEHVEAVAAALLQDVNFPPMNCTLCSHELNHDS